MICNGLGKLAHGLFPAQALPLSRVELGFQQLILILKTSIS